ncbi:MAG: class I SAM-dependent methyltransferase [Bacteroidia bacterium]|nr:class I SAM-dependent methyltransferase [Bacteroidia bacterium]
MNNVTKWNEWNEHLSPRYPHEKLIQFMLRRYKPEQRNINVLDLGCGNGVNTKFLAENGFKVYACDISDVGIRKTKELLENHNLKIEDLQVCSIAEINYPEEHFECIVSVGVFDSAGKEEVTKALPLIKKIMKKNAVGFFLFAASDDYRMQNNFMNIYGYNENEVKELFNPVFEKYYLDHYITTYNNQTQKQHDFIVTVFK